MRGEGWKLRMSWVTSKIAKKKNEDREKERGTRLEKLKKP